MNANHSESAHSSIAIDLPQVRVREVRVNAYGCLPVLLLVLQLQDAFAAHARRLLRLLFIRLRPVPDDSSATFLLTIATRWHNARGSQ